jgi:hypothetical protein
MRNHPYQHLSDRVVVVAQNSRTGVGVGRSGGWCSSLALHQALRLAMLPVCPATCSPAPASNATEQENPGIVSQSHSCVSFIVARVCRAKESLVLRHLLSRIWDGSEAGCLCIQTGSARRGARRLGTSASGGRTDSRSPAARTQSDSSPRQVTSHSALPAVQTWQRGKHSTLRMSSVYPFTPVTTIPWMK